MQNKEDADTFETELAINHSSTDLDPTKYSTGLRARSTAHCDFTKQKIIPPVHKKHVKSAPKPLVKITPRKSTRDGTMLRRSESSNLEYVSSQIIGYRLPPLPNAAMLSSSPVTYDLPDHSDHPTTPIESPRRRIVVKIPHDALKT